jgi:hypothetical protein
MSWYDFDFLGSEAWEFSTDARDLVLEVFTLTTEKLDEQWKEFEKLMGKRIAAATDEGDSGAAYQEMDWEEELQRQRKQAAGALELDWLMYSVKDTLNRAKRYFKESRPPKPIYPGKSWIARIKSEYLHRFGIDLAKGPNFTRIEELILARNAGIHREGETLKEYLNLIKEPRFVDEAEQFYVTKDTLLATIGESEKFIEWVISELKRLRPTKAEAAIPKSAKSALS